MPQITDTDLPANPVLFRSRLAGKTVYCAGAEIDVEALPARVITYIDSASREATGKRNGTVYAMLYIAYGVKTIRGLRDETGADVTPERESVAIIGKTYTPLTLDFVERLDPGLLRPLANEIVDLTNCSASDNLRLDFTPPSQSG